MFRVPRTLQFILIAAMMIAVVVPFSARAAAWQGLVPCGTEGHPCTPCDLVLLVIQLTNFMITYLALPLALLMFMYSGFVFAFSGGSAPRIAAGKKVLTNTVLGLLIVLGGYFIVDTLIKAFTGDFKSFSSGKASFNLQKLGPWNAPTLAGYGCKFGGKTTEPKAGSLDQQTSKIRGYINSAAYIFGLFLMGLSVIMILFSAYTYITSAGSAEKVQQARQILIFALVGVAIALLAYTLPRLVTSFFTESSRPSIVPASNQPGEGKAP